jgi:plasmid stabilization system protein ParE
MGFRVVITKPGINDLAEIVRFISRDNPSAGERMGFRLIDMAESLCELPLRGRIVPERKQRDCREIIFKPYRIVYRVNEEKNLVEVLRFWHGARGTPVIIEEE